MVVELPVFDGVGECVLAAEPVDVPVLGGVELGVTVCDAVLLNDGVCVLVFVALTVNGGVPAADTDIEPVTLRDEVDVRVANAVSLADLVFDALPVLLRVIGGVPVVVPLPVLLAVPDLVMGAVCVGEPVTGGVELGEAEFEGVFDVLLLDDLVLDGLAVRLRVSGAVIEAVTLPVLLAVPDLVTGAVCVGEPVTGGVELGDAVSEPVFDVLLLDDFVLEGLPVDDFVFDTLPV